MRILSVALGLALFCSTAAHAAPKDEARRAFNDGLELIAAGDYDGGIAEFQRAYDLVPHPAVLYNIARAYADDGQYENAIEYFELYLATEPIDRSEVEANVRTLQSRLDARAPEVVEASEAPVSSGPVATASELAELRRHAEELSALAEALAAREQAALDAPTAPVVDEGEPVVGVEVPIDEPVGLEGALVEDLFERVVVTASRYGQDPLDAPSAITVLTAEDIAMSSAVSIPELLTRVPGLDVMQLTAAQGDVSARGFNRRLSNKLLVLIDGRSVYLDFIGSTLWEALPVSLEEIERIEVIRGPGSASYGANAFAGVVNIITKTPGDPANDNVVRLGAGTKGTLSGSAMLSGREAGMGYRFSAGYDQLGRWARRVDLAERPDLMSPLDDQDVSLDMLRANGQVDWRVGEQGFLSVSGGVASGMTEFVSLGALREFYLEQDNVYARTDIGWGRLHGRVFYNRLDGMAGNWYETVGGTTTAAELRSDVLDATVDGNFDLGQSGNHTLLVGANYRYKAIAWGFLDADHTQHHVGGFVQEESRFGPVLVNAAVRVDKHPLIDNPIPSPRLALVTRLGEGRSLRVNAGTAFRTPTFMESYANLYIATDVDGVWANTLGDPELAPERIASVEVGFLEQSSDVFRGELAAYGFQVDNLIDLSGLDTSAKPFDGFDDETGSYIAGTSSFINEAPIFRGIGAEASAEYFGIDGLDLYANYAYERIAELEQDKAIGRATPRHKVNGGATWRTPWTLDAGLQVSWVDRTVWPIRGFDDAGQIVVVDTDTPGRTIVSNRVVWHVPLGERRLDLTADAWNWLADVTGDVEHHPLGQPVGSRYHGSVQYRF
ncbi:MAG: TonB-dependent receptor [Proteobacteria bacterium]|nr:TonB-dependent receptor [Pseudomonadota bacterium]MCP4917232.1 TonB-dependent receptor [Pseudomonadota bacterium]